MSLEKTTNQFGLALIISIVLATATGVFVLAYGKLESFQLINSHHSGYQDIFFKYYTYAGDGLMWLLVLIISFIFKRKYALAVLIAVVISTLLSQFLKRVVFIDDLRPITYLSENFPVHVIEGVKMNKLHSFPSGHSTAAFTMALILAHMINKKSWSVILPVMALLVGYSRVYLAQHFVTDVFAGIILGIFSAILSLLLYQNFLKRKTTIQG